MKSSGHVFPPILEPGDLPAKVLVLVAHPDDEIIGIGGLLAFHGRRKDRVRVLHATSGGGGDPEGRYGDLKELRARESREALARLGIPGPSGLGFEDGSLEANETRLVRRLESIFAEEEPELLYTFHGGEFHSDHRTVARSACAARRSLPPPCRIHLFGVNQVPSFAALYDYTAWVHEKKAALACFRSQLAYLDFATKVMQRDQAATVNVELPGITHCELVLVVDREGWPSHLEDMERALERGSFPGNRRDG